MNNKEKVLRQILKNMDINELWFFAEGYFNSNEVQKVINEEKVVPLEGRCIIGAMLNKGIWDKFRKVHAKIFYPICPSCYQRYVKF